MNAVKTRMQSFKRPAQAKVMGGKVNTKDENAPKKAAPPRLNTSLMRMAMSQNRRTQATHNSEVMADAQGTIRQGTMDRDSQMFQAIDQQMQGVDALLQSLGAQ